MTIFASILVPLDGSATAAQSVECATWLASRLGARLHIVSVTPRKLPAPDELRRLHVPEEDWPILELHQSTGDPADAIAEAIGDHRADLVVMTARGSAVEAATSGDVDLTRIMGHVTRAVVERCRAPVLLIPTSYKTVLPWQRLLVPVSGGTESDHAVELSVRIADALNLSVVVAHVTDDCASRDDELGARTRYSDELHYEFAGQLEEIVARAVPTLTAGQRRRIRGMPLSRGQIVDELLHLVRRDAISALAVGWHGQLAAGRAEILKQLLPVLEVPILLVRSEAPAPFRLNVGEELA